MDAARIRVAVAVAVVEAGSCSSHVTASPGTLRVPRSWGARASPRDGDVLARRPKHPSRPQNRRTKRKPWAKAEPSGGTCPMSPGSRWFSCCPGVSETASSVVLAAFIRGRLRLLPVCAQTPVPEAATLTCVLLSLGDSFFRFVLSVPSTDIISAPNTCCKRLSRFVVRLLTLRVLLFFSTSA